MRLFFVLFLALLPLRSATAPSAPLPVVEHPIENRLRLFQTHTGEHIDIIYRRGETYLPEALTKLDNFLRDSLTGEVHHYDPRVFDILHDLTERLGKTREEIQIICGYRTAATNEYLRETTTGVAKKSLHMLAEAIDIRIPGLKTSIYRDAALALKRGGVGFYPTSNFIHVDVGPVRRW